MPSISRRQCLGVITTGALTAVAGCQTYSCSTADPGTASFSQFHGDGQNTNAADDLPDITNTGSYWTTTIDDATELTGLAALGERAVVVGQRTSSGGILAAVPLYDGTPGTTITLEKTATGTPALADSIAIIPMLGDYSDPSTGEVAAIDVEAEERLWTYEPVGRPNPVTVHDGLAVISSDSGEVTGIEIESGAVEWTQAFEDSQQRARIPAPPAVTTNSVYLSALGSAAEGVYALERDSGAVEWSVSGPNIPTAMTQATDHLFGCYSEHELAAFSLDGDGSQWSYPLHSGELVAPAVAVDQVVAADQRTIAAVTPSDGNQQWKQSLDVQGPPVIAGSSVLVPVAGGIVGLNRESGEELWTMSEKTDSLCVPIESGFLYTSGNSVTLQTNCG